MNDFKQVGVYVFSKHVVGASQLLYTIPDPSVTLYTVDDVIVAKLVHAYRDGEANRYYIVVNPLEKAA